MNLRRPGRRVLAGLAAAVLVLAAAIAVIAVASRPAPISARNLFIAVTDGPHDNQRVLLDATFFTPAGRGRVPAILLAHGFGETKNAVRPEAEQLARAGFAVLTWSARGFGKSTGQIALDSPDYEVKDVEQLVSWLARQPRVLLDHPGDPRVGIAGASYGGAIALLAAAYDHRIDAIVPQITWNNLATALFPDAAGGGPRGGVFKRQWAGLLFTQGSAGFGTGGQDAPGQHVASQCGRFLPRICAIYRQVATLGRPTPAAVSLLQRSSPASVASRIGVPALLIQGMHDSLFGLDQANANYQAIRRNGAPADMVWFAGGHDGGDQETSRVNALTEQWFDRWLKPPDRPFHAASGQPAFTVTRPLGFDPSSEEEILGVATAPDYPGLGGTRQTLLRLSGPPQTIIRPPGGAPASISVFPGLGSLGGLTFDIPGQSAAFTSAPLTAPVQVTGAPVARIRVSGAAQVTLFAKVYDVDQAGNATLPDQLAAPLRVTGTAAGRDVTIRLPAIDYQFAAGHRLRLVLTTTDFAYATPPQAATYQVALAGPGLSLPSDPALTVVNGGVPWWTWAAPLAALAAAALILAAGRRREQDALVPGLAGVPLEITGLTKRYHDGQLAVDGLSLRVERGQVLGLLGPNGAGKTTTLRILMGLIHQDAGTIMIFGRPVRPGAPALSRLGSFVEGPGFLPHLSGRANLDLYWRATGRPAGHAQLAHVVAIAGLGTAIDRPVRAYSRGMCQRLAIAQAMLGLPDLLVLDEPMNGLDPPQIREMRDVLVRYAADGAAVILSSHMLAEVEQTCTHVVVMGMGRRLAAGPVGEIVGAGSALVVGTPQVQRAVDVLAGMHGIDGAERHPDGVLVHPNGVAASAVVAALVGAGIPVERVTPNRRLEDAFLALIAGSAGTAMATGGDLAGSGPAGHGDPVPGDGPEGALVTATASAPGPGSPGGAGMASASAPGYSPRRTLPLRVEAIRQLRRRRTMIAFGILLVLPWILVGAFEVSGPASAGGGTPGLVTAATHGGLNFAAFAFFVSAGFLLVVAVALFCGDTVASEASWASLRYLLAAPVPRSRLLRQKLAVALTYSAVAIVTLVAMALVAGTVAFGWHPLRLPGTGVDLPFGTAFARLGIVLGYVLITELVVAALAFLLSVSTDSPLGAVGGAVGLVIVSNILDAVTALGSWREILPTHWQFAWLDAVQAQVTWGGMIEGASVSVCYALILFALAFRHFRVRDIVS